MEKKQWGFCGAILVSLGLIEYGLFVALMWYSAGFRWSQPEHMCGLEILGIILITYPAFILGLLLRLGLLFRWKMPYWQWGVPLLLCGIASCAFEISAAMGIFCIAAMLILPVVDFYGCRNVIRQKKSSSGLTEN